MKKEIFILDTNALLYDPSIIYAFPQAEVVIPQTVLIELDRLKTSRVDRQLRFRGREVSRVLFELAEQGQLVEGIELENKSKVRVALFDPNKPFPSTLNPKASDDQILALTSQVSWDNPDAQVFLVSNDLNMLLKAQILGINLRRFRERFNFWQRTNKFIRTNQKTIISWATGLFFTLIVLIVFWQLGLISRKSSIETLPPSIVQQLQAYQDVEQTYLKELQENPNDFDALVGLGDFYFHSKRYQKAVETYKKAVELRPFDFNLKLQLAETYLRLGTEDLAVKELKSILKEDPKNVAALTRLGNYYFDKGQYSEAQKYYEMVLTLEPKNNDVRTDMAIALFRSGQAEAALENLDKVIENDPNHLLAHYNRGVVYWKGLGQLEKAKKDFETYLELEPQGQLAEQARAAIRLITGELQKKEG
jgi:cytochrome c-type biogenesis protein CcmH/NrfG